MRVSPGRRGSNSTCSDDRSALATAPSQRSPQLFPGPSIALSPAVPNVAKSLRPLIVDRRSSSSAPWSPSEYPRRAPRGGVYPSRPRRAPRRSLSEPTIHGTAIRLRGIATSRPPRRRCDPPREDRGPTPSSELSAKTAGPRHPGPTPSSELSAKTAGPRHPVSSPLDRRSRPPSAYPRRARGVAATPPRLNTRRTKQQPRRAHCSPSPSKTTRRACRASPTTRRAARPPAPGRRGTTRLSRGWASASRRSPPRGRRPGAPLLRHAIRSSRRRRRRRNISRGATSRRLARRRDNAATRSSAPTRATAPAD